MNICEECGQLIVQPYKHKCLVLTNNQAAELFKIASMTCSYLVRVEIALGTRSKLSEVVNFLEILRYKVTDKEGNYEF